MTHTTQSMQPRRCVFSTANDTYVPMSVVSLLTFARHNPDCDLFVLCGKISNENRRLCTQCGVQPVELDLSDSFYQEWRYPRECFYHFKGPQFFASKGYAFSIYIDGDTYCNAPFRWDANDFHLAGVSYDTIGEFFVEIGDFEAVALRFAVPGFKHRRIQSGVLVYDNVAMAEFDLFSKAAALFDTSLNVGVPRKGDDSLLALLIGMHPEMRTRVLSSEHNFIDFKADPTASKDFDSKLIDKCVVYHFVKDKPWFDWVVPPTYAHKFFMDKWLEMMVNWFDQNEVERCFPAYLALGQAPTGSTTTTVSDNVLTLKQQRKVGRARCR